MQIYQMLGFITPYNAENLPLTYPRNPKNDVAPTLFLTNNVNISLLGFTKPSKLLIRNSHYKNQRLL